MTTPDHKKILPALLLTLFTLSLSISGISSAAKSLDFPPKLEGCYNTQGAKEMCLSRCERSAKSPNKTLTVESHYALCEEGCKKGENLFVENYTWAKQQGEKYLCRKIQNSNRADLAASQEAQSRGMNDSAKSAFKNGVNVYFWAAKKLGH